ncbi:MAG TPA: C4-type zinc ribbon domain-containing protein [Candidatus Binatia bacterium]|nr:C4-type zinc ribbon domain-containing protein [Candidatus Binatia bacterium]
MESQIEVLAKLQLVDQSLRAKTLEVADGEKRVAALEEAVRVQTAAASAAREEAAALGARQRDLEARLAAAEAKMKDRRMRITRIRNEKELGLAKREVELLKEETTQLETELVAVMEQVEAANAKRDAVESELARLTAERDSEAAELREKIERLTSEIEHDRATRTAIVESVDGELRRKYEMIFSRRGGLAVVEIRAGTCQGCRMRIPPQLFNEIQRREKVILCPNCQRMLYWRNEAEEANG